MRLSAILPLYRQYWARNWGHGIGAGESGPGVISHSDCQPVLTGEFGRSRFRMPAGGGRLASPSLLRKSPWRDFPALNSSVFHRANRGQVQFFYVAENYTMQITPGPIRVGPDSRSFHEANRIV